jgi:nucleotide-binding universal stress UspA family protein
MPLKDILVIVDNGNSCKARVQLAATLAEQHGAHLIGLFVRNQPHVPQFIMSQLGPEVARVQQAWAGEAAKTAKAQFDAVVEKTSLSTEWRDAEGLLAEETVVHARYVDLVIVGQHEDTGDMAAEGQDTMVDHLVLECGRPVLIVPYAGGFTTVGRRAMVAWNATREATRAANDALPLLQSADKVDVVAVNPRSGHGRDGHGPLPSADIALHLARHGVNAVAQHIEAHDTDAGTALLSWAAEQGVDLMVMGAYGRSRLRELVLGGATRHILRQMTVPVLMSH